MFPGYRSWLWERRNLELTHNGHSVEKKRLNPRHSHHNNRGHIVQYTQKEGEIAQAATCILNSLNHTTCIQIIIQAISLSFAWYPEQITTSPRDTSFCIRFPILSVAEFNPAHPPLVSDITQADGLHFTKETLWDVLTKLNWVGRAKGNHTVELRKVLPQLMLEVLDHKTWRQGQVSHQRRGVYLLQTVRPKSPGLHLAKTYVLPVWPTGAHQGTVPPNLTRMRP